MKDERCYRTFSFRDDETNEQYSDQMEIKILELPKLPKEIPECGSVYDWMRFFRGKTKEEFEKMAAEYEYFDVAYNKLKFHIDGKSNEEIAALCDIPLETVEETLR